MKQRSRNRQAGLTLLEVMVVLAIIALVAGLATPKLMESFGRAKSRTAALQMENLKGAVQLFYIDVGRYPTEAEGLEALLVAPASLDGWRGPYLDGPGSINDPWERRYLFSAPGTTQPFELQTYGRDGKAGGSNEDSDISL